MSSSSGDLAATAAAGHAASAPTARERQAKRYGIAAALLQRQGTQ